MVRLVDAVWLHAQKTYRLEQAASAFVPNGTDGGNESLRIVCSFGTNERIDDWENAPIDAYGMHFVPFSHLVGNNFVVPVQTQPLWEQGGTAIWLS